jgi:hypothetical protein
MNGGARELSKTAVVREVPLGIPETLRQTMHEEVEPLWTRIYAKAHGLTPGGFHALEREVREEALKLGGKVLGWASSGHSTIARSAGKGSRRLG